MTQKDIKRYTLQSYIGTLLENINITQSTESAIKKMSFLSDPQFNKLVDDILEEIHNRSLNKKEDTKLSRLSDKKFRNLVLDTFLVYTHKNPGKKNLKVEELIGELESLIGDLKGENKEISGILNEMDVGRKFYLYCEYLRNVFKRHNEDLEIINQMEIFFGEFFISDLENNSNIKNKPEFQYKLEMKNKLNFDEFLNDKKLIEYADTILKSNPEYEFYKFNLKNQNKIIKKNQFIGIIGLIYDELTKFDLNNEITELIKVLELFKENENHNEIHSKLENIVNNLKLKLGNIEILENIKIKILNNENVNDILFELVEFIKFQLVRNI